MTRLESQKLTLAKPYDEVYAFFSKFRNYAQLMPSSVNKFDATDDTCIIGIKKMGSLPMRITSREANLIKATKNGDALFNFDFEAIVQPTAGGTTVQLVLDADLNPMLKMVAAKPLAGFLDILVTRYAEKA
jgi:carbon monoxide dehydrogenase subunit G